MTNRATILPVVALGIMVSGCLAPTVPAEVCKSNIVRGLQALPKAFPTDGYIEDNITNYRKFDEHLDALIASIDEKNCRKETLRGVGHLKATAQKIHDAVVAYERGSAESATRSVAEKNILGLIEEVGMAYDDIRNS